MAVTQPISPKQLDENSRLNLNFSTLYEEINNALEKAAGKQDVNPLNPLKISIRSIPNWAIETIAKDYKAHGWLAVRVTSNTGQFVNLEFLPAE